MSRLGGTAFKFRCLSRCCRGSQGPVMSPGKSYYSPNGMVDEESNARPDFYAQRGIDRAGRCFARGYYVEFAGSSSQTICAAGYYTSSSASSSPAPASPGYYVANQGSSSETICPGGYYASGSGTITPTICPAGFYAPQGSSAPILCPGG